MPKKSNNATAASANEADDNRFLHVLAALDKGRAQARAGEKLAALVEAVAATGKGGSLSLAITLSPEETAVGLVMKIGYEVKAKLPEGKAAPSIFYVDENDGFALLRNPPRQREFWEQREAREQAAQAAAVETVPAVNE